MLQRDNYVSNVESSRFFGETADLLEIEKEFSARAILEDVKKLLTALKRVLHLHDKRVSDLLEDAPLG
jgi:hypothetical protein